MRHAVLKLPSNETFEKLGIFPCMGILILKKFTRGTSAYLWFKTTSLPNKKIYHSRKQADEH
jgi:hypothetical protein